MASCLQLHCDVVASLQASRRLLPGPLPPPPPQMPPELYRALPVALAPVLANPLNLLAGGLEAR